MSLFPAYSDEAQKLENVPIEKPSWLENSSFNAELTVINKPSDGKRDVTGSSGNSHDKELRPKRKVSKKKKTKLEASVPESSQEKDEDFYVDLKGSKEFLSVNTISRPAVSKYRVKYYLTRNNRITKKKFKRYYKRLERIEKKDENKEEKITKENISQAPISIRDENFTGFDQEEDLSKQTAFYNKTLTENPHDVKLWLEYVEFQDSVYQFEKSYRKGSIAKAQRVLAERKIAILEKALTHNLGSEELLRERLKVAVSAFPSDELQAQLKKLVDKEQDNIILWQGYIEATQCSMSHCNTPAVIDLYSRCLQTLHKLRRATISEKYLSEESILRMLYQCGLFLKQAGLFEQLWTLLKMYLDLNLSPTDSNRFNIGKAFDEKELLELEEVVLSSQLPHHELWLRTEKLRESCHWLPVTDEECVDPQRIVFNEDVAELIHPITMPENIFKLVATILTLLKVPLIPCRHATMQDLGLDYVPWSLDSIECLLPVFLKLYPVNTLHDNLLKDINRYAVGPQYLKVLPGQEEYLNFILTLMENCTDSLNGLDQISVRIWWFRFQRLLIVLQKRGHFKMSDQLKKRIKSSIKNLLKKEQHRNNELYYVEYALIEKEFGNVDQCIKILQTALQMNKNQKIVTEKWEQCQVNQCYLYRSLIECIIDLDDIESDSTKGKVIKLLVNLVLQRKVDNVTTGILMETETKFRLITDEILQGNIRTLTAVDHFLPDFLTDWIICYGWFIYFYRGLLQCGTLLETILEKFESKGNNLIYQEEVVYEFYCSILFKHCIDNPGSGTFKILDDVLFRAIETYPNNLYMLSILAKEQSMVKNLGTSWWKVEKILLKSERAITTIFSVLIFSLVKLEIENDTHDTVTGNHISLSSFHNKILSLFKKITKQNMCARRCGLIWRLYLNFVYSYFNSTECSKVYYIAVEECPWLKALYMDAAIYIPAELAKIQDLIIEKGLRLHVTPEELEELRT